jgi:hypothetical protein
VKDSPGRQAIDGPLDQVADPADLRAEFSFPFEKAAELGFPDGRQPAIPDVALVADPAGWADPPPGQPLQWYHSTTQTSCKGTSEPTGTPETDVISVRFLDIGKPETITAPAHFGNEVTHG